MNFDRLFSTSSATSSSPTKRRTSFMDSAFLNSDTKGFMDGSVNTVIQRVQLTSSRDTDSEAYNKNGETVTISELAALECE